MTLREIKALKWTGKRELYKVDNNLYVEVLKDKKVYRLIVKKQGKQIKATIGDVSDIALTEAKAIRNKIIGMIQGKNYEESALLIRNELGKKESKKDKELRIKVIQEKERFLLKNVIQTYLEQEDKKDQGRIKNYIIPALGNYDVRSLSHTDIINSLIKNINDLNKGNSKANTTKNKVETASELMRILRNFYKYLFIHHNITNNPASYIDKKVITSILGKNEVEHYKAITDISELQELYKKISELKVSEETKNKNDIQITTKNLMLFLLLTALRIGTARHLKWEYINWNNKVIDIPQEITKTKIAFRLPLTNKLTELLREIKKYHNKERGYIFINRNGNPVTEASINKHLKRLSANKTTSHGFRSSFSTILKERGHDYVAIETQLMHKLENSVGQVYTRTDYLERRRKLLEAWEQLISPEILKGVIKINF
jgi:integrase